ncbi:hypothetical protein EDB89DRAFT_1952505, partial [Lactarius sanguifluus]
MCSYGCYSFLVQCGHLPLITVCLAQWFLQLFARRPFVVVLGVFFQVMVRVLVQFSHGITGCVYCFVGPLVFG